MCYVLDVFCGGSGGSGVGGGGGGGGGGGEGSFWPGELCLDSLCVR